MGLCSISCSKMFSIGYIISILEVEKKQMDKEKVMKFVIGVSFIYCTDSNFFLS